MTIIEKPDDFCFAGNRIRYIVQSTNELEGILYLKIGSNVVATLNASKYNGKYNFGDIGDVVRAFLSNNLNFQNAFFTNINSIKTFNVEIRIKSGSNPDDTYFTDFTAVTGGLPVEIINNFWDLQISTQPLLTQQPNPKTIAFGAIEYLSFANFAWNGDRCRIVKIKYADGSEEYQDTYLGVFDDVGIETHRVQLGTDITYNTAKKVLWYEVSFNDNYSFYETSKQKYIIDYTDRRNKREFLWGNSLGGFDTLRITGEQESTANYEYEFASEIGLDKFSQNVFFGASSTPTILMTNEHEVSTGFHSKNYIAYLRDFFLSKQKYIIFEGKAYPIFINSKKIKYADDGNGLKAITFSYYFPNQAAYFHPKMI